jgi:hypothetical protein
MSQQLLSYIGSCRKATWVLALLALCTLMAPQSIQAQVITGTFSGTAMDQTGAVVPGAEVTLLNQATRDARRSVSNGAGYFTFAGANPGLYTLIVEAKGFQSWKQADLTLNAGDSREVKGIALAIGSSAQTVQVQSGSLELAPTDNGERSALLSSADINRLSIESRNVSELLKILPGVTTVANGTGNGTQFDFTNSGSTGSTVGVGLSPNGAPYRGGSAYILDGANIIDPGCNCWSLATVNPDMTAEVKVQTSNFGADSANGPVIFNAVSKSGSSSFHGQAYLYTRNGVLNSNLWENNHAGTKRTEDAYYYPGGNFGGPVRLPFTDFNRNNKLLFWTGYEYYNQNLGSSNILQSWVPTDGMKAGNFSLSGAGNAAACPGGFTSTSTNWCNDLTGARDSSGNLIANPANIPIDPGAKALMSLFPAANVDPATHNGYNYYQATGSQHNGWVWRGRVDYNLTDNMKVFVAYQEGRDTNSQIAHIYYNPTGAVPFPGGPINNPTTSRVATVNILNIFSPTLTNEFVFAWGYVTSPYVPTNLKTSYISTIGYPYGTVYNGSPIAPGINSAGFDTFPDMSQSDIWGASGSYPGSKGTPSFSDNVTKVWRSHSFKFGAFTQLANNYQGGYYPANGTFSFASKIQADAIDPSKTIGSNNPTANLVMGIASSFTQTSAAPVTNMAFRTTSFYAMDDWKTTRRLTLNIGARFEHLGRWYDRSGVGLAAWFPSRYAADVASGRSLPGVYWHAIDKSVPNSGSPIPALYVSPRLGFAYDAKGTGKTVIRGGWGIYRWNDQYNDYGGPLSTAQALKNYNTSSGNITFAEVGALGANASSLGSLPSSVSAADPTDNKIPTTYAYNLTVSQQLPWRSLFEIAYVGNSTSNLLMGGQSSGTAIGGTDFTNQNKVARGAVFHNDPVTGAPAPVDPDNQSTYNLTDYFPYYQGYGQNSINMNTHNGYSNYNGLQVSWVKQAGRLSFDLNYTFSKSLGIVNGTVDPYTVHGNYGVLSIDRPNVINTSYAYDFARVYSGGQWLLRGVANNWTISGTTTWQAGGNLQANSSQNLGLTVKDTAQNETLSSLSYYGNPKQMILPAEHCNTLNLQCFTPPAIGQLGQRQIGYLSGPSYFNSDLTVYKAFHIKEKQSVEVRASAFNFLNHPLWKYSSNSLITPTFTTADRATFINTSQSNVPTGTTWGQVDTKTGRRLGELSVKYNF